MKNLNITDVFTKNKLKVALAGIGIILTLTGGGCNTENTNDNKETENVTNDKKVYEGILMIGDESFLVEYINISSNINNDTINIQLSDGTYLRTTFDNFYKYDKDSETMNKIKQLIIDEDHIIK